MGKKRELQLEFSESDSTNETSERLDWRGMSVQFSRLNLPSEYEFEWDGNCHYLAHHDLVLVDGEMEVLGERPVRGTDLRDQMTYVPAGQTIKGWSQPADRLNAFTVVCFDPCKMKEELQVEFSGFDPKAHIYFQDKELGATMRKLGRYMAEQSSTGSKIYAESLSLTAALEMLRYSLMNTCIEKPGTYSSGELSKSQRKLVHDYIEENLSRDIGLDELAGVAGLTRFHFSRAFKATHGQPPYQYVNQRHIECAQRMLATTTLPISSVASACGFNGATQFGRSFRSAIGKTPLAFRKSN